MRGVVHVVDDDASFRTAVERRLKKAGYEVETYSSAQHLLDRLPDETGPGCILLDVRIPGLSGPELQGRLSKLGSTLPIVFLTGYAESHIHSSFRSVPKLLKPYQPHHLAAAMRRTFVLDPPPPQTIAAPDAA